MSSAVFVSVAERSLVGEARRRASRLAEAEGLDEAAVGRLAVVVTELAANLVDHADRGDLFARPLDRSDGGGIEVTVVDRGDGIPDVDRALADGYSTRGSAGEGLGAVARVADLFDVHSVPGEGTVATAVVRTGPRRVRGGDGATPPTLGSVIRPHPDEEVAGDAWGLRREAGRTAVVVVDGLGHGPGAEKAARRALESFQAGAWPGTAESIRRMHGALRSTRGAAGAVLEVDLDGRCVRYAGVGNVSACLLDGERKRSLVSMNGTLGLRIRSVREYEHPCEPGCVVVMHTDGIRGRWSAERVAGLMGRPPSLLCGSLYQSGYRGRDDATVVALSCDELRRLERGGAS